MKKLVLFIHGLGGTADRTWQKFPNLIREDRELADLYDVGAFEYSTGKIGSRPSLAICAASLKTEIESRYPKYSDIALIAHSQGGLVARYYIAERLNGGQPLRVSRLLTFATPHQGSWHASLVKRLPFISQQVEDLDPNSQFLHSLGVAWGQAKADRRVLTQYVVAADDIWVGPVSAMGLWSPAYQVVSSVDHQSIVEPETADRTSFLIAKNFLLEDSIQPGGVEADYRAPLLRFYHVAPAHTARFLYSAGVLPFFGREAEIDILADFLGSPGQPFRWMVMHGSGGVGKSRLAFELCRAVRDEWHAGFLPQSGQEPDWGRWQPLMPTLIVIDLAALESARIGPIIRSLAGRSVADGTLRLAAPVRILLIERTGDGDWLDKIMGVEATKAQVKADLAPNLQLETLPDPWPIFEFIFGRAKRLPPDQTETLAALGEIDRERRALYAYFMADAMVAGRDVRHFDSDRLLEDIIDRDRQAYWRPAGATAKEERLLALATMVGGLPVSTLADITEKLLPSWDVDRHPAIFRTMTGRESAESIAPLEPDIVGEHFTLACLTQGNLSNEDRARFCGLAWLINPRGMAQFMLLAHRDLEGNAMLCWVRKPPLSDGPPQLFWSKAAVNLTRHLRSSDPDAARALLDHMRDVAAQHDEAALWELWAEAAFSLTYHLGSSDPDAARALLDQMRGVAARHDEAVLWEWWAMAAFNLTNDVGSRDPDAARALLDHIRGVAAQHDEAPPWELWAKAAFSLTNDIGSRDPDAARALLAEVLALPRLEILDRLGQGGFGGLYVYV